MRRGLTILGLLAVAATPAVAQKRVAVPRPRPVVVPPRVDSVVPAAPRPRPPSPAPRQRHLALSTYVLSRLDDNVNRDETRLMSVGMATGLTGYWQSGGSRPWGTMEYDVALHRYTATERFNRLSQRLRTTLSGRVQRWWVLDLVAEGSLKGSSEDRDVSDQVTLQPRTEFRLGGSTRLRLVGTQRWRRFPTDSLQDASNRYAAAELRQRLPGGAVLELTGRREENAARGARFDFHRTIAGAGLDIPLGRHLAASLGAEHRWQAYPGRTVTVGDAEVMRRDRRLLPEASIEARLAGVEVSLAVEPEWRRSNDPDKAYAQHVVLFGMRRRW